MGRLCQTGQRWLVLAVAACLLAACSTPYQFHGLLKQPRAPAPALPLPDRDDRPFDFARQAGQVVLITFGYTASPDTCPIILTQLAQVKRELAGDASRMQVVFVTIDPERDTLAELQRYVAAFDPSFIGLRGAPADLAPILAAYAITVTERLPTAQWPGHALDHTPGVFVVDAGGWLIERLPYGTPVNEIVSDVRYLLSRERRDSP